MNTGNGDAKISRWITEYGFLLALEETKYFSQPTSLQPLLYKLGRLRQTPSIANKAAAGMLFIGGLMANVGDLVSSRYRLLMSLI